MREKEPVEILPSQRQRKEYTTHKIDWRKEYLGETSSQIPRLN
jgi:hypothetical protein